MCPYTHLQGLQEVRVRDSLRPTTDQREVAVAQSPEAADTMSRQCCGSRARAEVRELQGVQIRDSPVPAMSTRSHNRCSRTCRADTTGLIMECHDRADSDTSRGRDECLRVNTAPDGCPR